MIEIGSLIATTAVDIVAAELGDLSACVMTQCVGDRIFDRVPASMSLLDGHEGVSDPTFSVTSVVLTADLH